MSYTIMVLDFDETPTLAAVHAALEAAEADATNGVSHSPTAKLAAFAQDVAAAFPSLEADHTNSAGLGGRALSFSVSKMDLLFDVLMEFDEIAWKHDTILFNPQDSSIQRPRDE